MGPTSPEGTAESDKSEKDFVESTSLIGALAEFALCQHQSVASDETNAIRPSNSGVMMRMSK